MKKILSAALVVALMPGASCTKEPKNETTVNKVVTAYNLVTAIDGTTSPAVSKSNYTVTVKYPGNTLQLTTDGVVLPGGGVAKFTTNDMKLDNGGYVKVDDRMCEIIGFKAADAFETGDKVTDLNGLLTQAAYPPGNINIEGIKRFVPCQSLHYLVMSYQLNSRWLVRTFWPDVTFRGNTACTYPGMEAPMSSDKVSYRIMMHLDESWAVTDKADIVLYNAKFAPDELESTVVLMNLDLTFDNQGYKISGGNVVPSIIESGKLVEKPEYTFDSIEFVSGGNMTSGTCIYKVGGIYDCTFTGNCFAEF